MLIFPAVNVVSSANDLVRVGNSGHLTTVMMLANGQTGTWACGFVWGSVNYFEDFQVNQRITFGRYKVTQAEIINFATQYDPQVFHVDEDHPLTEELGGILASGWHSTAIFMRLAVDAYLGKAALLTSPGVDELRWLAPVRAGDTISGEALVERARLSVSKPDRGILTTSVRLWNQEDVEVLKMTTHAFVRVRP